MLVGGYINHYMDGGAGGTSSLSLAIEVYDAKSGTLLWSMSQGGLMDARQVHDFYLFSITEPNLKTRQAAHSVPLPGTWDDRCWAGWTRADRQPRILVDRYAQIQGILIRNAHKAFKRPGERALGAFEMLCGRDHFCAG